MTEVLAHIDHAFAADHLAQLDRELDSAALVPADDSSTTATVSEPQRGPLVTTLAGLGTPVWYL
jgi:hypothetical protein